MQKGEKSPFFMCLCFCKLRTHEIRNMNFKLRPWHKNDLKDLVHFANNKKIANNLTDAFPHPYTEKDGIGFINMASNDRPTLIFAIEVDGIAAGGIGLHQQTDLHKKNMELGYWLADIHWGKGIMSAAVREMAEYGFKTFPINRIYARPFGTNKGSQRVLQKAGFTLEGTFEKALYKNGEYIDELIYAVRKS